MRTETEEDRRTDADERETGRGKRVTVGSLSGTIAILISYAVHERWGKDMPIEVVISISTLIGSLITTAALCARDFQGLALAWVYRGRRHVDRVRKANRDNR